MSQMPPSNQFPDQMPPGGHPQYPPQKGGGAGKVILIVLGVLAVLGLVCAGACGFMMWNAGRAFNEVGKQIEAELEKLNALTIVEADIAIAVKENEEVNEKLGKPVQYLGEDHGEAHSDEAEMKFNSDTGRTVKKTFIVKGEKSEAKATFSATWQNEEWVVTSIEVTCDDGTKISVPPPKKDPNDITIPGIPLDSETGDSAK